MDEDDRRLLTGLGPARCRSHQGCHTGDQPGSLFERGGIVDRHPSFPFCESRRGSCSSRPQAAATNAGKDAAWRSSIRSPSANLLFTDGIMTTKSARRLSEVMMRSSEITPKTLWLRRRGSTPSEPPHICIYIYQRPKDELWRKCLIFLVVDLAGPRLSPG